MEDYDGEKSKANINKNEPRQMSFSEYFYNNIDFMPILQESLDEMKKFINYITSKMKDINKEEKQNMFISEKIFEFMLKNSEKLGIPFFYQLVSDEQFKNILMNLFLDNIYTEQIKELLGKIIDIFNIDYKQREINNPIYSFYNECINCGILEQNDIKESEARESFTEEEMLFLEVISLKLNWMEYINIGLDEDVKSYFGQLLLYCEEHLIKIMGEEILPKSNIEFYKEKINEIKNFNNKKNQVKEKKTNLNKDNKKNTNFDDIDFYYESDEEEDEEIMTQEKIIEDIKELRKKDLQYRTYFYKDEVIKEDENEYIEYKNYKFPLGEKEKELERQFCAFLNTNGGRIYLGIDDSKTVKGVIAKQKLTNYESKIFDLVHKFRPKIEPKDYFKFYALPIKNKTNGKIINNLFIFKIVIKRGDPTELYYVNEKGLNIATRQAGQCPNLKASEIYEKIIERKNMKKLIQNQIKNGIIVDFDDPEPLINKKILENENLKGNWRGQINRGYKNNYYNRNKKANHKNNYNANYNNDNNKYNKNDNFHKNDNSHKNKNYNKNNNNFNNNTFHDSNIGFDKKKNKKKKKKNNKNNSIKVLITNIDKDVQEQNMIELFKSFNCKEIKLFQDQNGIRNGHIIFDTEEEANNFIGTFDGFTFGSKNISVKKAFY